MILIVYSALAWSWVFIMDPEGYDQLGPLIFLAILIGVHTLVNGILTIVFFVKEKKEKGLAFLLNTFLIPIIGLSTCYGGIIAAGL
ncbi:MAG: hypothetical protein ACR2MX_16715 [Cyclobacteriaceae bacterium]